MLVLVVVLLLLLLFVLVTVLDSSTIDQQCRSKPRHLREHDNLNNRLVTHLKIMNYYILIIKHRDLDGACLRANETRKEKNQSQDSIKGTCTLAMYLQFHKVRGNTS